MLKVKSNKAEKHIVVAEDLSKKYLTLSTGTYDKNYAKLDQIEIIKNDIGIAVVRSMGKLTGPWYANTQYSIDNIPEDYKPAYGLSKTICGDVNFFYNQNTNQIIFTPRTDKPTGTIISFAEMYFLAKTSGGGYKNPTKLFKRIYTCLSKST